MADTCRRCGHDCGNKCASWTLQSDTRCGVAFVGPSIYGRPFLFITDEEHDVVMIRIEDAGAVARALLDFVAGVGVTRA